ncbi:hypothetical protein [Micropruina sp.]|uniref:hypothetical protein n=1 Tax=Micropruina sp. TaxID=2737536 RepID=UPI0039E307F4
MQTVLRLVMVVVMTVSLGVAAPVPVACACSCAGLDTAQAVSAASAVFEGEVLSSAQGSPSGEPTGWFYADPVDYTIAITRVYKGNLPAKLVVRSSASESSCGLQLSGHVLVFAHGDNDTLTTTLCSAPIELDRSKLGAGRAPEAVPALTPSATPSAMPADALPQPFDAAPLLLATAAALLLMSALLSWLTRRP